MIAYRFHSIEADGPWTSPPFPPAERRHIVQGVIGGFIMKRPRWATDLDGNFIYGLDAKGKEMKSPPSTRHATKKRSAADRLFIGTFPTGISYADRQREKDGDYLRIAFLPFSTLKLEWSPGKHPPDLKKIIERDAAQMAKRRGQEYQVSTSGQTVTLGRGHATKKSPAQLDREIAESLAGRGSSTRLHATVNKFSSKQIAGYLRADREPLGISANDNYNVAEYGITRAEYGEIKRAMHSKYGMFPERTPAGVRKALQS